MTRPMSHPLWCDPSSCTAYDDADLLERLHRSRPHPIRKRLDEMTLYAYVIQDPDSGPATVELVLLADPQPLPDLWWIGGDVRQEMSLELAEADEVHDAIKTLTHLARRRP